MKSCRRVVGAASAGSSPNRRTLPTPERSSSLARAAIQPVASESAGPPCGGLYLKPPSRGGLCDGVTTMPSASPVRADEAPSRWTPSDVAAPLCSRIACDTAGVGVYPSRASMCTSTPAAASTSSAVCHAGSDSAWGVPADEERSVGAPAAPVLDDRRGDRDDVRLVEGTVEARAAVAGRAEHHLLAGVVEVRGAVVVRGGEGIEVDEVLGKGDSSGARVHGSILPPARRCRPVGGIGSLPVVGSLRTDL